MGWLPGYWDDALTVLLVAVFLFGLVIGVVAGATYSRYSVEIHVERAR